MEDYEKYMFRETHEWYHYEVLQVKRYQKKMNTNFVFFDPYWKSEEEIPFRISERRNNEIDKPLRIRITRYIRPILI